MMVVLCPCGCGLAAKNVEGDPHPGHEAAAKAPALAHHREVARQNLSNGPRRNGKVERRERARARKAQCQGAG